MIPTIPLQAYQKIHPTLRSGIATHISGNYNKVCDSSVREVYEKCFSIFMTAS